MVLLLILGGLRGLMEISGVCVCVCVGGGVRVQWMNPGVCLLVAMTAAFLIIGYL